MKEITLDATIENITEVTAFVDEQLEMMECPMKAQIQIDVAIDEIFGNIAHYAYSPAVGKATVRVAELNERSGCEISFIDEGVPFDPLEKDDPDVSLSLDERQVGGLGIFMVKKTMDDIGYEYKDGKNILKIKKYF
ncbi:MAG: ATP-binding protein [Lachnospiraceae bacterium]